MIICDCIRIRFALQMAIPERHWHDVRAFLLEFPLYLDGRSSYLYSLNHSIS
jgi:hypothetical protein